MRKLIDTLNSPCVVLAMVSVSFAALWIAY